jgi:hypothetical protein
LGNTPQAFSHFPLIHCALQLQQGRIHSSDTPMPRPATGSHAANP